MNPNGRSHPPPSASSPDTGYGLSSARLRPVAVAFSLARMSTVSRRLGPIAGLLIALVPSTSTLAAEGDSGPKPGYRGALDVEFGYAPESTLHLGSTDVGKLSTTHSHVRYAGTFISGGDVNWTMALDYDRYGFGVPSGQPLPRALGSVSIPLGVSWKLSDRWSFRGEVAPGVYSDFKDLDGPDFNAPITAGISYAVSENLVLSATISFDARRDTPLVGGPGIWWRINPKWTLSLMLPRPRVEYRPWDNWLLFGGLEIAGGAYQTSNDAGSKHGVPAMDNVNISYREIRAGVGAQWDLGHGFSLELAGGYMLDRRLLVHERRLLWNGDGAPYARAQLSYRY